MSDKIVLIEQGSLLCFVCRFDSVGRRVSRARLNV